MIAKGQKISDRYEIIKSIGEGGMANVYMAFDTILERNVAVKVLRGDLSSDEKFVRRFQREAIQASSLSHENIVEVYDVGEDNGDYYIVMEYVEGKHLKGLLKKRGKLTLPEVIDIMVQVTSGLSVAHDSYIIHRDIKPQNIMILENGLVKLTDFGIAVAMNSTQLTQTNSVMGSVHYLPPEQANGKGATLQSDIYSLGILMYELITGKLPYRGDNAVEVALKHLKEPMPSVRQSVPDIPQSIENIILRATAKNPKNRYADAREMNEDLKTCLDSSRKTEERVTYKYPEYEYSEAKVTKNVKKEINQMKKNNNPDEIVAKKITQDDLKGQNKLIVILASIFTGLVVIITTIVLLLPKITKSSKVEVPDVTNMTEAKAKTTLKKAGFVITETVEENSNTIEEGYIIKTNPSSGSTRKEGSDIKLYVSLGTKEIKIEDYTGQDYSFIQGKLDALGITVFIEYEDADGDEDVEPDTILRQSVPADSTLTEGDSITLYVLNGSVYPDFTTGDYSLSDLLSFCEENDLTISYKDKSGKKLAIDNDNIGEYMDVAIIKQSRSAGTKLTKGSSITITLDISADGEQNSELD